jgi:hypothetical protein
MQEIVPLTLKMARGIGQPADAAASPVRKRFVEGRVFIAVSTFLVPCRQLQVSVSSMLIKGRGNPSGQPLDCRQRWASSCMKLQTLLQL